MTKKQIQAPGVFAHHRAAVTNLYSVMPPEGILESRLPGFRATKVRVQAAPVMGAGFAQVLLEMAPEGGMSAPITDGLQHFFYVVGGQARLQLEGNAHLLGPGAYAYAPPGSQLQLDNVAAETTQVVWIRKAYEALPGVSAPRPLVSHRDQVEKVNKHTQGRYWQHLLPDSDLAFDFAINILEFQPGNYFPMVETHVMEHGLYMLEGQGMYLLQDSWHECWSGDFVYMAPFCPQFFYATGWAKAAYLLYKNVNRDVISG